MGGVIQQRQDEPCGFLLQGPSLNILLTKPVLESSSRWPCLWKGKDLPGLLMVFSKGPAAVRGPGGAAFVPEQFGVCINSPVRFWLAGSLGRNTPPCVCLSLEMSPSAGCFMFFPVPLPALTSVCQAFQTARYGSAMI